jgi:tetratricopeptide (TPR) repeat protein
MILVCGAHRHVMVIQSEIQDPRLRGEKKFQDFCLKLARRYWNDPHAQLHGRQGQAQHGVDITGEDKINNLHPVAMQAKGSESNNPRKFDDGDLVKEVEKAKNFKPKLKLLIVAYNGERDQVLQKKAIDVTAHHQSEGLFKVVVWAWDDIISEALNFQDVIQELSLENKFPVAGHLDPARPRGDLAGPLQKIQAALAEAQAAYLDVSGAAPNDDPVSNAKIDVWKDQIVAGDGAGVVKSLRTFIEGLPGDGPARVRFRAYANLGSALIQAGDNDAAIEAFEKAVAADTGTADAHAYAARVAVLMTAFSLLPKLSMRSPSSLLSNSLLPSSPMRRLPI